jgi:3-hydroxyacyl-CoA dehydrogenase
VTETDRSHLLFDSAHTQCTRDAGVALLTFTQATPRISADILDAFHRALDIAERDRLPLVITSAAEHFAMGADLDAELAAAADGHTEALERLLDRYQRTMLRLRHASVPTIAALRGAAISGGCEVVMHCTRIVANPFSGIGLGEASIGVIPGGGGVKEFALRASRSSEPAVAIETAFDVIANGRIGRGIDDALRLGFLDETTLARANDHVGSARRVGLELAADHRPPPPNPRFRVAGTNLRTRVIARQRAALERGELGAQQFEGNSRIAWVLCGGDAPGSYRDEADLLAYEREKFLELVRMPGTQARIAHFTKTGELLKN